MVGAEMLDELEISTRRDVAIKRALNTPPKPNSAYVGVTDRAQDLKQSRARKTKPKGKDGKAGAA